MADRQITLGEGVTAIQWTEGALETLRAMGERVGALARHFGEDSSETRKAAVSYLQVVNNIHGWGDVAVSKDGELSLFVATRNKDGRPAGFVFGVIWHEDRRRCTNDGCEAYITDEGKAWWYEPEAERKTCGTEHVPSVPLDAPMPGTWSTHS